MACRSTERAEAARKELYQALDVHIVQLRSQRDYDGHADVFRRNLKIEIEYLDLSVLSSVFNFSVQMSKQYVATWITEATDTEIRIDIRTYRT
jgi:3-keto steroid reductase